MGIANELTSDVAAAVLAQRNEKLPFETERLIEIIRNFHSALRDLSNKERCKRVCRQADDDQSDASNLAASGGH